MKKFLLMFWLLVLSASLWGQYTPPSGGGGASPAGSAGCVQLYATSSTFGCDTDFVGDTVNHLFKITGAPITPFTGLYVGPNESALPSAIQNYTGTNSQKITAVSGVIALGIEQENGIGVYIGTAGTGGGTTYGVEADVGLFSNGAMGLGFVSGPYADGAIAANNVYGFYAYAPAVYSGATMADVYQFYSHELVDGTNKYYSWFDSDGVGRCREDNAFNSVGQVICVVYNPQVTKYIPGAANYERIVYGQFASNRAQIGTEAAGSGVKRPVDIISANFSVVSTLTPAVSNTSANSCGTTAGTISGNDNAFKVVVGATAGTSCTVTFATTFINAPSCWVNNETTANLSRATSTTTTVILAGTFVAGDTLSGGCIGR